MIMRKRYIARLIFSLEILIFGGFYFLGSNGIMKMVEMKESSMLLEKEIAVLSADVEELHSQIAVQKSHPFFKEKIAREQLQMARAHEEVYLLV